jgi:ribosomal protein S21
MKDKKVRFSDKEKQLQPLMVEVHDQDRLDAALKKLKRMIKDSRIMVEYQEHLEFKKPSAKRREKLIRARGRMHRFVQEEKSRGV